MQVDGEPCRLLPSIITLSLKNKANLLAKSRSDKRSAQMPDNTELQFFIRKLNLSDYVSILI